MCVCVAGKKGKFKEVEIESVKTMKVELTSQQMSCSAEVTETQKKLFFLFPASSAARRGRLRWFQMGNEGGKERKKHASIDHTQVEPAFVMKCVNDL